MEVITRQEFTIGGYDYTYDIEADVTHDNELIDVDEMGRRNCKSTYDIEAIKINPLSAYFGNDEIDITNESRDTVIAMCDLNMKQNWDVVSRELEEEFNK